MAQSVSLNLISSRVHDFSHACSRYHFKMRESLQPPKCQRSVRERDSESVRRSVKCEHAQAGGRSFKDHVPCGWGQTGISRKHTIHGQEKVGVSENTPVWAGKEGSLQSHSLCEQKKRFTGTPSHMDWAKESRDQDHVTAYRLHPRSQLSCVVGAQ